MNTIVHTPTPDLEKSLDFYRRLHFQVVPHPDQHFVSDGKVLIRINPDRFARAGLQLFRASWEAALSGLEKMTEVRRTDSGYLLGSPSGVRIYLEEGDSGLETDLENVPTSDLGKFAGLSLETTDLARSTVLWGMLGFEESMGSVDQGWISLQNADEFTVSLMRPNTCPHLFFNPSLTYFNGKNNLEVIQKVRDAGVPITEEITHFNQEGIVDNIIIRDPGGYGFFLFND